MKIDMDKIDTRATLRAIELGAKQGERPWQVIVAGRTIDLSSSGHDDWQIVKNILQQLEEQNP